MSGKPARSEGRFLPLGTRSLVSPFGNYCALAALTCYRSTERNTKQIDETHYGIVARLNGLPINATPKQIATIGARLNAWEVKPGGCEGYRTAEVTLGGIDTDEVSSKTFELKQVPGLFAIGEALDVTGWLGGYNFQWAWASGWCCAQSL